MVNYYFRSMATASKKCVNLEWRSKGRVSKLWHTTLPQVSSLSPPPRQKSIGILRIVGWYVDGRPLRSLIGRLH